jgi:hypothetical protein
LRPRLGPLARDAQHSLVQTQDLPAFGALSSGFIQPARALREKDARRATVALGNPVRAPLAACSQ